MTDIEALLSVDEGHVPEGAVAFFMRDAQAEMTRRRAILAGLLAAITVAAAFCGASRAGVVLLALATGICAVFATPTLSGEVRTPRKRRVVVVTQNGIIMRDGQGLRTWLFADLQDVSSWHHADRVDLLMVFRDGSKGFINCHWFHRGETLPDVVRQHLPAHTV
ncbi:MAG TPA: hypothetical protein VGP07_26555 [Polyangia bacterium]|jgi:hypothetical protein